MQEAFLHYIWQYQYFDKKELVTIDGSTLLVKLQGFINTNAGPDFLASAVRIGDIDWRGNIEIHLKSSDWEAHKHQTDLAYNNVILHVVWEYDKPILRADGTVIPTLELNSRVDLSVFDRYDKLTGRNDSLIPCSSTFSSIPEIIKKEMLDKAVMERLIIKSKAITERLEDNKGDWEETAYQLLLRSFGLKVNAHAFEALSKKLPFSLIKKNGIDLKSIEALLFGVAGFLNENPKDAYTKELQEYYTYIKHKHSINNEMSTAEWKLLRLRPASFPTLRLAQLASFLKSIDSLFDSFLNTSNLRELQLLFKVSPDDYWYTHYQLGQSTKKHSSSLGKGTIDLIFVNTIIPLLVSYGKSIEDQSYIDRALAWLEEISSESNKITRVFGSLDLKSTSALESQGMIQLYNSYCQKRNCLKCSIGNQIIKPR